MTEQELAATFEGLYTRLQAGTLTDADLIGIDELTWPDVAGFVPRVYADAALFDTHFGSFKDPYDIFRIFSEDDTVLDVGADWGYSAIAMRHQGCRARIVSIEAMPFNIPPLDALKRIAGSHYDYVHLAAGERAEKLRFYVPVLNGSGVSGLSSTGGTLTPWFAKLLSSRAQWFPPKHEGDEDQARIAILEVDAAPLDDILLGQRVVAVKMDVEGHEAAALDGADRLLRVQKPLLMLEGGGPDVVAFLKSRGYFFASRSDGRLYRRDGPTPSGDRFWVHPDRADAYRDAGLLEGALVA